MKRPVFYVRTFRYLVNQYWTCRTTDAWTSLYKFQVLDNIV